MRRAALILAMTLALAGCATATELAPSTAEGLQASVVEVSTLASDGDVTGALARLDALQSELDAAVAAGDVSAERVASIQQAIDLVRADLEALVPEPEPTPTPTAEKPGKGNDKPGKPEKPGKP